MNIAEESSDFDVNRDGPTKKCIYFGILESIDALGRKHESSEAKRRKWEALSFLGHYLGDVHQPLHAGKKTDLGGNSIKIYWYGSRSNLHKVWD